jgi:oxygen-independent coproporphyrinogen-3 oxidase
MRIVVDSVEKRVLERAIREEIRADYVYMYPPRQAYRPMPAGVDMRHHVAESLRYSNSIDLYFHFPFCKQVCSFCNLFTSGTSRREVFDKYIDAMIRELLSFAEWIRGKRVETLYFGGGTPSLMSASQIARVIVAAEELTGSSVADVREVSLEVAPDTVDALALRELRSIGVNRINLGVQSTEDDVLRGIGRAHNKKIPFAALESALKVGFDNVCVDLIYGLEGQTAESWRRSVTEVCVLRPETICLYPLTLRPMTAYHRGGYTVLDSKEQFAKYDIGLQIVQDAGYKQQTHVRYVRAEKGGYLQKENHWRMHNVLGIGAGARSYLWYCDLRNGYSLNDRQRVISTTVLLSMVPLFRFE